MAVNSPYSDRLTIMQLNMGKGRESLDLMVRAMVDSDICLAAIQEPYMYDNRPPVLPWQLQAHYCLNPNKRIKSIIISNKTKINVITNELSTENLAICDLTLEGRKYHFLSGYFEPTGDLSGHLDRLDTILRNINCNRAIFCFDSNAKSVSWHSKRNDCRGIMLEAWIAQHGLYIFNLPGEPTFQSHQGESGIDVTLGGAGVLTMVNEWHVADTETLYDHRAIKFVVDIGARRGVTATPSYNLKRANWGDLLTTLEHRFHLRGITIEAIEELHNERALDAMVDVLTETIREACDQHIPQVKRKKPVCPWWNTALQVMCNKVNVHRKRYCKNKHPVLRDALYSRYKTERQLYKKMIKNAKTQSWKNYCEFGDDTDVYKKIYNIYKRTKSNCSDTLKLKTQAGQNTVTNPNEIQN